ncbi:MAG: hypothetical protein ACE5R6_11425 [Candidatus Heimdallarchaeota archaeon]
METIVKWIIYDNRKTVEAFLLELGLATSYIVLINGKIAKLKALINKWDEVIILPQLARGSYTSKIYTRILSEF